MSGAAREETYDIVAGGGGVWPAIGLPEPRASSIASARNAAG